MKRARYRLTFLALMLFLVAFARLLNARDACSFAQYQGRLIYPYAQCVSAEFFSPTLFGNEDS